MQRVVLLAVAGAMGALTRYALGTWIQTGSGRTFPWGTLGVNMAGCFLAGAFWAFSEERLPLDSETRLAVLVGFMGAFTTFSAFMLETSHLMRDAQYWHAAGNVFLQNGAGIAALFLGLAAGRIL